MRKAWNPWLPLLALAGAAGCVDDDPAAPAPGPTAELRLVNGAGGMGALDLVVDGAIVVAAVPYEAASGYVEVPAGVRSVAVREAGTDTELASLQATLAGDGGYSVLAGAATLNLAARVPGDTGAVRVDRANIRIVNVAPPFTDSAGVPPPLPLDVHVVPAGTVLAGRQAELTLDSRVPSYSTLLWFEPGTWQVRFAAAATDSVVAETGMLSIGAGVVRAVLLEQPEDGVWTVAVVEE